MQVAAGAHRRAAADRRGAAFQLPINTQGRLTDAERVRRHHRRSRRRRRRHAPARRRARRARRQRLRAALAARQQAGRRHRRSSSSPAPTPSQISDDVRATMAELKTRFPAGRRLPHRLRSDRLRARIDRGGRRTRCSRRSLLVVLVVILFLQTWRATIIPLVAVPVSLIGTFAVMLVLGFSLNALSLFGLVLAIGIVVDDAIVVVENVERNIEHGPGAARGRRARRCARSRADRRHRAGAMRGVRADRVHQRPHRAVLPAVRADDRHLDGDLGVQLADAEPALCRRAAASATTRRRTG